MLDYYARERIETLADNAEFYAEMFNDEKALRMSHMLRHRRDLYHHYRNILYWDLQVYYPEYNQCWFWRKIKLLRIVEQYINE